MSENPTASGSPCVVVGVDGSASAGRALDWAIDEARLRKIPLRIVHAWMFGYIGGSANTYRNWAPSVGAYTSVGEDLQDVRSAAEDLVAQAIGDARADLSGVEIERNVVQGAAAKVLIDAARADDLLVVGTRGHGEIAGLLLGSVSHQCVQHALCPVVVVRAPSGPRVD
jgi:nucleotide-binding universal stress UspA family protein